MLRLGPLTSAPVFQEQRTQFYGAHQAVFPENARELVVSAWYATTPEVGQFRVRGASAQSERDALSMVVMYTLEDHMKGEQETKSVLLALNESRSDDSGKWISVCLHVGPDAAGRNISSVHVFFHFHDHNSGNVLIDDVSVFHVGEEDTEMISTCYRTATRNNLAGPHVGWVGKIIEYGGESDCIHLRAMVRPKQKQLTLAVPMTVDRVVRLEAMSRLYGGGPIVAAVVVSDESEARVFSQIWKAKMWLREHVDVQFVKRGADGGALAINVLRNIAVRMGETDFIVMLDVDMTPASRAFDCMRDENGTYLEQMLPIGEKRILTLPVFVGDVHQRSAADKEEVLNAVGRRAATTYCVNSQKANKMKRWYRMSGAGETRFMTDYEPYGIVRRDMHPSYDERFHGYGFNKISWGAGAEAGGWRMFVASDRMVTHLNHVENGWVSDMGAGQYLETWRAFFAFAAETESGRGRMREVARRARDGMRQCDACGASRGTRW